MRLFVDRLGTVTVTVTVTVTGGGFRGTMPVRHERSTSTAQAQPPPQKLVLQPTTVVMTQMEDSFRRFRIKPVRRSRTVFGLQLLFVFFDFLSTDLISAGLISSSSLSSSSLRRADQHQHARTTASRLHQHQRGCSKRVTGLQVSGLQPDQRSLLICACTTFLRVHSSQS